MHNVGGHEVALGQGPAAVGAVGGHRIGRDQGGVLQDQGDADVVAPVVASGKDARVPGVEGAAGVDERDLEAGRGARLEGDRGRADPQRADWTFTGASAWAAVSVAENLLKATSIVDLAIPALSLALRSTSSRRRSR